MKSCDDCAAPCSYRARRCRTCFNREREDKGHPATAEARAAMSASAYRRHSDAPARRERACTMWRDGATVRAIAEALCVGVCRVRVYLRQTGARD